MTIAAFSYWDNRIAPLFDTSKKVLVVEAAAGAIMKEREEILPEELPNGKPVRLAELGVTTLVCGAISRPMHELISAYGIKVVPFIGGETKDVVKAWFSGELEEERFRMPGCCSNGHHH